MIVDFSKTYLYKLRQLTNLLDGVLDKIVRENSDLGLTQITLLLAIGQLKNPKQRETAKFLEMTPAAVSRQVEIARSKGWIKVGNLANDRRSQHLILTRKGQSVVKKGLKSLDKTLSDIFKDENLQTSLMNHIDILLNRARKFKK